MATWKAVLAVEAMSVPLLIYASFSVGIATSKVLAIRHHDRWPASGSSVETTFRRIGSIVMGLAAVYILTSVATLYIPHIEQRYEKWPAIAIATVATVEIIGSAMGAHSARRNSEPVMESLKLVNLAGCSVLVVLTQTALLSFAQDRDVSGYNALAGVLFGVVAALLGFRIYTRRAAIDGEPARSGFDTRLHGQ